MLVSDFMDNVNDAVRGTDDDTPVEGTTDWKYWLRVANRKNAELYGDTNNQLPTSWQLLEIGTIKAGSTVSFDLDDNFIGTSDNAYIIYGDTNQRLDIDIIKPQEKDYRKQQIFISGSNPQTLFFTKAIMNDESIIGGKLYMGAFVMPDVLVLGSDTVICEDPYWLVMATAAEIAANDLTYEDKAPDLNAKANNLYKIMIRKSRRGTYGNPRKSPINVRRIGERQSWR